MFSCEDFFYSYKHIDVNIVSVQDSMLFILRMEELFSIMSKQRKKPILTYF